MVSPVMLRRWMSEQLTAGVVGVEGEQCLTQGAGVSRDDEADLRHLPAPVGAGFVVDDDDVVEQQHAGSDGAAGTAGQLLGPLQGAASELETVEVDAAEAEHGGTEHVAQRTWLLFDHAVGGEGAHDAVNRGAGQVEASGQFTEAQTSGSLQGQQDPDRSVNALDQWGIFLE